jgi:hypothetical protein
MNIPFFGDIAWFYLSARNALLFSQFPWLGIATSITWLHQGPLWTYMIIPAFLLSNFHPLSPVILNLILIIFLVFGFYFLISKLFNKNLAFLGVMILIFNPWLMMHLRAPYHTAPIPLFEVVFFLYLIKQRSFLSGLFLGLLYQLHLLTFVFWPLLLVFGILNLRSALGFILGILPFIVSGPVQTLGIFAWLIKYIFVGFGVAGLASEAYRVVLFVPGLLLFFLILHKLPKILKILIAVVTLLFVNLTFDLTRYAPFYDQFKESAKLGVDVYGQDSKFASATMPFEYLTWWLNRVK